MYAGIGGVMRSVLKRVIYGSVRAIAGASGIARLEQFRRRQKVGREFKRDAARYMTHSATVIDPDGYSVDNVDALLTMDYHRLEKGMALAQPRPWFGREVVERVVAQLNADPDRRSRRVSQIASSALREYVENQKEAAPEWAQGAIELIRSTDLQGSEGGTQSLEADEVRRGAAVDFKRFVRLRRSVRHFATTDVPWELLEEAVSLARYTPSVCNRQSWRVHAFSRSDGADEALRHQNGNRGFGEDAAWVLLVTVDLRYFVSPGERYQGWIDGGMFAMSLIYSLHSLGLGTCPLNWSVESDTDDALRQSVELPEYEQVIMMIAVGHLPDRLAVAQSPRRDIRELLKRGGLRSRT